LFTVFIAKQMIHPDLTRTAGNQLSVIGLCIIACFSTNWSHGMLDSMHSGLPKIILSNKNEDMQCAAIKKYKVQLRMP